MFGAAAELWLATSMTAGTNDGARRRPPIPAALLAAMRTVVRRQRVTSRNLADPRPLSRLSATIAAFCQRTRCVAVLRQ